MSPNRISPENEVTASPRGAPIPRKSGQGQTIDVQSQHQMHKNEHQHKHEHHEHQHKHEHEHHHKHKEDKDESCIPVHERSGMLEEKKSYKSPPNNKTLFLKHGQEGV